MAVHQYIGARYVPYYYENSLDPTSTEWEPNVNYEALTVVTLPNQHSYISKKAVPDTIGSPALNAEYWLDTGSDNAYIQNLQDQIDAITGTDLPAIRSDISDLALDVGTIKKRVVCVGDSYMAHGTKPWQLCMKDLLNVANTDFFAFHELSSGFAVAGQQGNTFETLLAANIGSVTDPDTITDVIIAGGTNDFYSFSTEAALVSAIESMNAYCKTEFPNAKIWIVFCGYYTAMDATMFQNYQITRQAYVTTIENRVRGIDAGLPMKVWGYRYDPQHPNDKGSAKIAEIIYNAMYGSTSYIYGRSAGVLTLPAGYTDLGGSNAIHINILNNGAQIIIMNVNVSASGTVSRNSPIVLGTYNAADVQRIQSALKDITYIIYFKDGNGVQHRIPCYIQTTVSGTTVTVSAVPSMDPNDAFAYIGFLSLDQVFDIPSDMI